MAQQQTWVEFITWLQQNEPELYACCRGYIIPDESHRTIAIIKEGISDRLYLAIDNAKQQFSRTFSSKPGSRH